MSTIKARELDTLTACTVHDMTHDELVTLTLRLVPMAKHQRRELARLQRQYDEARMLIDGYRRREEGTT